jgi:hypothetical protein
MRFTSRRKAVRDASKISERLRNFGGSQSNRRLPLVTTFAHVTDPASVSWELALAGVLARFLRLKMWDFVCHLSELRVASKHWKLSALAVVTGVGLPTVFDAAEADKRGGICCQRKAASVRPR